MLVELAVGDSLGAGWEYVDPTAVAAAEDLLAGYHQHPKFHHMVPGHYTDDTQMSVVIAEALLDDDPWTRLSLAERFVQGFHRDPRHGYSSAFYGVLQASTSGEELLARVIGDSNKNGGAMRAAPCGLLPGVRDVVLYARDQAAVTHNSPIGKAAAVAAALMTHYTHYRRGARTHIGAYIQRVIPRTAFYQWNTPYKGSVSGFGIYAVRAAITAIAAHDSLSEILRACITFTGDTDTVATIAMAAASRATDVKQDLPAHLLDGLENGTYGRDYLKQLDEKLLAKFPSPT